MKSNSKITFVLAGIILILPLFVLLYSSISGTGDSSSQRVSAAVYGDNGLSKTMLSGSDNDELVIRGSSATIDGDLHTNHTFRHQGSSLTVDGTLSAVNEVDDGNNIEDTQENANFVEMPDMVEDIREVAEEADTEYYENTKRFSGARYTLEDSIITDESFRFNVARVTGNGNIIAADDIAFNTARVIGDEDERMVIMSEEGDINIRGALFDINGIIYAPEGTVRISAANVNVNGRIIANEIVFNGSTLNVSGSEDDFDFLSREEHTLEIDHEGEGSVKVDGDLVEPPFSGSFEEGAEVFLETIGDDGWEFYAWTGEDVDNVNEVQEKETKIIIDGDKEITAFFADESEEKYDLDFEVQGFMGAEGEIQDLTDHPPYPPGFEVEIKAVPEDPEEHIFTHWGIEKTNPGGFLDPIKYFEDHEDFHTIVTIPAYQFRIYAFFTTRAGEEVFYDHTDFGDIKEGEYGVHYDFWDISEVEEGTTLDFYFQARNIPDRFKVHYGDIEEGHHVYTEVFNSKWVSINPQNYIDPGMYQPDPKHHDWHEDVELSDRITFRGEPGGKYESIITKEEGKDFLMIEIEGRDSGTIWDYTVDKGDLVKEGSIKINNPHKATFNSNHYRSDTYHFRPHGHCLECGTFGGGLYNCTSEQCPPNSCHPDHYYLNGGCGLEAFTSIDTGFVATNERTAVFDVDISYPGLEVEGQVIDIFCRDTADHTWGNDGNVRIRIIGKYKNKAYKLGEIMYEHLDVQNQDNIYVEEGYIIKPGDDIAEVQHDNDRWPPHLHMELKEINYDLVNFISHVSEVEVHEKEDWIDFNRGEAGYVDEESFDDFYGPCDEIENFETVFDKGDIFYEFEIVGEGLTSFSVTTYTKIQDTQEVNLSQMDNEEKAEYYNEKFGDGPDDPFECPYGYEVKN